MSNTKSDFHQWVKMYTLGNTIEYNRHQLYYSMISRNRFRWKNLPLGVESRHLEDYLFWNGQFVMYYNEEEKMHLLLPCSGQGQNIYGDPTSYNVYGVNFNDVVLADKCVRCLDNNLAMPILYLISHELEILSNIELTKIANIKQQKFPFIVPVSKENRLSMENIFAQYEDGKEKIMVDQSIGKNGDIGIRVLQTNAPYVVDRLREEQEKTEGDILTKLGINNNAITKRERVVNSEVNANNQEIKTMLDMYLFQRQEFCRLANEKFGTKMEVELVGVDEIDLGGEEFGEIYS